MLDLFMIPKVQQSMQHDPLATYEALCHHVDHHADSGVSMPVDMKAISSSNVTVLHHVATHKRVDVIQKCPPVSFPMNRLNTKRDEDGRTALMLSVIPKNHKEPTSTKTLKYFLSKNPKLDIKDMDGNTALHIAGKAGFEEAFEILKRAGASQIVKNNKGKVPKLMDPSKCCIM